MLYETVSRLVADEHDLRMAALADYAWQFPASPRRRPNMRQLFRFASDSNWAERADRFARTWHAPQTARI